VALALQQVGPVDGGGGDVEQHLAGARTGIGLLGELQHFGAARLGDRDRAHGGRR